MKKIFLLAILSIGLCSCSNNQKLKNDIIQFSELKIENEYIIGKMKNTDEKAYDITIWFNLKSGSIEEKELCTETIKPKESKDLKCRLYHNEDDSFNLKINSIDIKEKKIPTLNEGEINFETLEYYFENISNSHLMNLFSIANKYDYDNPYLDKIEYDGEEIVISGNIKKDNITFVEFFDVNTEKLTMLSFLIPNNDEIHKDLIMNISIIPTFSADFNTSTKIVKALSKKDMEIGTCIQIDDWCYYSTASDSGIGIIID